MIIYAMQPYFFPYLGYFTGVKNSDIFVVFDVVKYKKQSWIARNRIINKDTEFTYIHIPTCKSKEGSHLIKDIQIAQKLNWEVKLIQQLNIYAKKAPYYKQVIDLVRTCLEFGGTSISEWNVNSILKVTEYLGIDCNIEVLSKSSKTIAPVYASDEWGLNITLAFGGDTYINLPGGMNFFDKEKFIKSNVELKFIKNNITPYNQIFKEFVPSLSIIDVMMFNSVEDVNRLIDDYVYL